MMTFGHAFEQTDGGDDREFAEFLRQLQQGEASAIERLVRDYEPVVLREVRRSMKDKRLSRLFDPSDVAQVVFCGFFNRVASGRFHLDNSGQLLCLLMTMARNTLASRYRSERRQKRDIRRMSTGAGRVFPRLASRDGDPCEILSRRELLCNARSRLPAEAWQMVELRQDGQTWMQIAELMGGNAHSRRVQLSRALQTLAEIRS